MKTKLILFFLTVLISLLIAPLRSGVIAIGVFEGFKLSSIVGFLIFFLFTYYAYKKKYLRKGNDLWIILLGVSIVTLPFRIFNFTGTLASSLEWIIHLISVLLGYTLYKTQKVYSRGLVIIVSAFIALGASTWGYDVWVNEINNRTYTKAYPVLPPETTFLSSQGDTVSLKDLKGQMLVLNFWSSSCGVCLRELPEFDKLYNQYKDRTDVGFYTVFCYNKTEDHTTGEEIQKEIGVNIPSLATGWKSETVDRFEVSRVPALFVIDKNGTVIYRCDIGLLSPFLKKHLLP